MPLCRSGSFLWHRLSHAHRRLLAPPRFGEGDKLDQFTPFPDHETVERRFFRETEPGHCFPPVWLWSPHVLALPVRACPACPLAHTPRWVCHQEYHKPWPGYLLSGETLLAIGRNPIVHSCLLESPPRLDSGAAVPGTRLLQACRRRQPHAGGPMCRAKYCRTDENRKNAIRTYQICREALLGGRRCPIFCGTFGVTVGRP